VAAGRGDSLGPDLSLDGRAALHRVRRRRHDLRVLGQPGRLVKKLSIIRHALAAKDI
jgi:hypothetical protein